MKLLAKYELHIAVLVALLICTTLFLDRPNFTTPFEYSFFPLFLVYVALRTKTDIQIRHPQVKRRFVVRGGALILLFIAPWLKSYFDV